MPVKATFGPQAGAASRRGPAPPGGRKPGGKDAGDEAAPLVLDTEIFEAAVKLKITEALDTNSPQVKFLQKGTKVAIRRRAEVATMYAPRSTEKEA